MYLTKDSSLLLYAIHSPFYRWILKKATPFSGFKNPNKKRKRLESIPDKHFVEGKNEGRKAGKDSSPRTLEYVQKH
jgi:hypothetical protein